MEIPALTTALTIAFVLAMAGTGEAQDIDSARVEEIAQMLPEHPEGLGRPVTDRDAWEQLARTAAFQQIVERAESLLDEPIPEQPDELYLEFSQTGNRTNWQRVAGIRRGRLAPLVLAECVEDQGRFIGAIVETVEALCGERTWVMPTQYRDLMNFNQ